ncbi:TM2 domain-containing protein [Parvularcula flava]|uniref:TM2 domain-containing protein n=1 Tax=Aquisalinus luteolus TaxID=1566827 RepID=A0A8J3A287_9PROT|nr:TM2 domain-containing protein [Aquisalinus luteolus]NHK28145.1 TM2 domain-containing protein [Aquisalinus luteolus]GGH97598.1 hypothetical protein GCM10011355_19210 [Aquisalinus luteolus]
MNFDDYYREYFSLRDGMTDEGKVHFDARYSADIRVPMHMFVFSIWLGWLGVDRFLLGHWGRGLGKLFTFGGLMIWAIIDWFLIGGDTRKRNMQMARNIVTDMRALETPEQLDGGQGDE